jgi:hypothetical protein
MQGLFYAFWWLIFPIGGLVFAGFQSWLKYRQQRATLDIIRTYAERGEQPPESLMARLDAQEAASGDYSTKSGPRSPAHYWSLVGLFGVMACGFVVGAFMGIDGHSGAFLIVALVMAAVAVWSLVNAVFLSRS